MAINVTNGKRMFVFGLLSLLFSIAFVSSSWLTALAFRGTEEAIFQTLRNIGLSLSILSIIFFARGLNRIFSRKSGVAILTVGAVVMVAGLWVLMGALFNLWGLNNMRGFASLFTVAIALFFVSAVLGYWGYCMSSFAEKKENKNKPIGRMVSVQPH